MRFLNRRPAYRPSGVERAGAGGGRGGYGPARIVHVREAKRRAVLRLIAKEAAARDAGAFDAVGGSEGDSADGLEEPGPEAGQAHLMPAI